VKTQTGHGIDIVSDGEQSKVSFQAYAADRLAGIEPIAPEPGERRTREKHRVPGVLCRRRAFGLGAGEMGLHRADQIYRARRARDRSRKSQARPAGSDTR